ncbi:MAG: isoprenylcysteine carboxylmethyltransferase family protein [Candidatus Binatus sp.]|uniref:methyltransferase family protein n=1 Tax=Candidatus Binatus sp. TaxID=2811406 RepID=UPI003BB087D0
MEAVAARIPAPTTAPQSHVTVAGLRHALGDCLLAVSFLLATLPAGRELSFSLAGAANIVWLTGAAIMAVMSFARFAPRSATVNLRTIAASGAMLILPCFMRPIDRSTGALATAGLLFELCGVVLTQVARVYMGRSFGILPANRGIVSKGPFRWVRHPIYLGWLILSIGYAMSYTNPRNVILIVATLPFMVWRIDQEETHLSADTAYRGYMDHVGYRLLPGVI